ncbi:MAG: ribonuclease III [Salinibacter sp.]|uniref:ribonuclease III n=1 Tax=Salinibacter sp. TaxID=2065818 RepID=UPI0035D525A0
MTDRSLPSDLDVSRSTIEHLVGRSVDNLTLYRRALTHRSLLRVHSGRSLRSNERLEFLGDAFLDLVVGKILYERFPEKDEGELTRFRARLVSESPLAMYARHLDLGTHLRMSTNAAQENGRDNPSILADAFEAFVGAVYLDQGYEAARRFVRERALAAFDLAEVATQDENYKSQLLEYMQARGWPQPTYRVVREDGPSHDKTFTVEVRVGDTAYEQGMAGSKQEAEQRAARRTLAQIAADEPAS